MTRPSSTGAMVLDESAGLRRLPIYLLLDCSRSMAGEPISALEMGVQTLLEDLRNDPASLDTVWLSIIAFSSAVELLMPLSDIEEAEVPDMKAEGTTALGEAIEFVADRIDEEVRKTNESQKGDWKPMVFVFTDGAPTDDWEDPVDEFHASGKAKIIACGAGPGIGDDVLRRLGHHSLRLHDTQPGTLTSFMQWVSVSVTAHSRSVGIGIDREEDLPPPPDDSILIQ